MMMRGQAWVYPGKNITLESRVFVDLIGSLLPLQMTEDQIMESHEEIAAQ